MPPSLRADLSAALTPLFLHIYNSMKVLRAFRTSALFVGSVVGAGFATGQEVLLFFGSDGAGSLLLASLFMSLCSFAFMQIGAKKGMNVKVAFTTDALVSLSSFAVYAAMIAAAEEVLAGLTGQNGLSVLLAVGVGVLSGKGRERLATLNLLAVPLMAAIIAVVGARSGGAVVGGFRPLSALAYGGMNLLFSGALMLKEGEESTLAERLMASLVSGGVIFLMLFFMRRAVSAGSDMPFLDAAFREGLGTAAQIGVLLAIVTTMASCAFLTADRLAALTRDPLFAVSLVTLVGILLSLFGFAAIVRTSYPVVSYLGLAATLFALGYSLFDFLRKGGRGILAKFSFRKTRVGD